MKRNLFFVCIICFLCSLCFVGCNGQQLSDEIKTIMSEAQVDQSQAELIYDKLKSAGIDGFNEFKHDSMLDSWDYDSQTGYRIKGDGFSNLILYLDGNKQIDIIRYADVDIYKGNEIIVDFDELILDSDEKTFLKTQTELTIKEYLTTPNSADFPWYDWEYRYSSCFVEDNNLNNVNMAEINSYVDAKNLFGVEVRHNFTMVYCNSINTNTWTKIYLSIGNQVYYDFIDDYIKNDNQQTNPPSNEDENQTSDIETNYPNFKVWVNNAGDKFHFDQSCAGKTATETTYALVLNMRKEPCDMCATYPDEKIVYIKDVYLENVVNNLALSHNENWASQILPKFVNVVVCDIDHLNKIVTVNYEIIITSDKRDDFENGVYNDIIDTAIASVDSFFENNIADMYGDGVLVGMAIFYIYE